MVSGRRHKRTFYMLRMFSFLIWELVTRVQCICKHSLDRMLQTYELLFPNANPKFICTLFDLPVLVLSNCNGNGREKKKPSKCAWSRKALGKR